MSKQRDQTFTIGRDKDCDIALADASISRLHAELRLESDGKLLLRDCNSTNGTALLDHGKEKPLGREYVVPEDEVRIGRLVMRVHDLIAPIRKRMETPRKTEVKVEAAQQEAFRKSERMIRCDCGAVIRKGERCPRCQSEQL